MRKGERVIGGRVFLLGGASPWFDRDSDREWVEREVAGLRAAWRLVRVFIDRRRQRVRLYVFGARE